MKIALLTNVPDDLETPRGGVQSTAVALLRALSTWSDFEVHAVAVNSNVRRDADRSFGRVQLHFRKAAPLPVLLGALTEQRRIVSNILRSLRPDIIHACDTSYFKVGRAFGPVVYQIQGTIAADSRFEGPFGLAASPAWRWLERRAVRDADAVIVNAPALGRLLGGHRVGPLFVCEEPVHEDFFRAARREDHRRVLCVGQISPLKNCPALVEAAAMVRRRGVDCEVHFAGDGSPQQVDELHSAIVRNGMTGQCHLLGRLSRGRLIAELSRAAVLAHPSLQEHLPAAIVEAMVVGVPVVASRVGGIPDVIDDAITGFLVEPGDVSGLADRLAALLSDAALRHRFSENGRQAARHRFHPEPAIRRLTECYKTVLRMKQSSQRVAVA